MAIHHAGVYLAHSLVSLHITYASLNRKVFSFALNSVRDNSLPRNERDANGVVHAASRATLMRREKIGDNSNIQIKATAIKTIPLF